jgi:hypothetical protein
MPASAQMWMEITFNIAYLIVIWGLVIKMFQRMPELPQETRRLAMLAAWAFGLLALGDSGHVGFRVLAYALGGLETQVQVVGRSVSLVGVGALSTAITVTFFYMLVLEAWRVRFKQAYGGFAYLLLAAGFVRLALMVPAINAWNSVVPLQPWSTIRNLPLMLQGLGVAYLILRDAARNRDQTFLRIGAMILVSYACYIPVILWVQQNPLLGMLMIPKTLAYVAIGFLIYFDLYRSPEVRPTRAVAGTS